VVQYLSLQTSRSSSLAATSRKLDESVPLPQGGACGSTWSRAPAVSPVLLEFADAPVPARHQNRAAPPAPRRSARPAAASPATTAGKARASRSRPHGRARRCTTAALPTRSSQTRGQPSRPDDIYFSSFMSFAVGLSSFLSFALFIWRLAQSCGDAPRI
jgi:hypothetical protein